MRAPPVPENEALRLDALRTVYCAYAVALNQPFCIPDTWKDPDFSDNPLVTGPPRILGPSATPNSLWAHALAASRN